MSVSLDTNSLAQQIKEVTLNAASSVAAVVTGNSGSQDEAAIDEKYRVYVGNLDSETTEDDIKKHFSQIGEIKSVSIKSKRTYGGAKSATPAIIAFVGYTNDADANKAVEQLNGKTIGEKEISVAIARPPLHKKKSKSGKPQASQQETTADTTKTEETPSGEAQPDSPASGKKKRTRKPKNKEVNGAPASDDKVDATEAVSKEADSKANGQSKSVPTRAPRERGPPRDGVPSSTTLFVAGLENTTSDDELKQLFSAYNPSSVHVALRPLQPYMIRRLAERGEARLGRGFGFVTFADQATQTKALEAMNGKPFGSKELAVKVAIDSVAEKEKMQKTPPTGLEKSVQPPAVESDTA